MVAARTGHASYRISVRLGIYKDVHASQLKLAEGEAVEGAGIPLAYRRVKPDAPVVERILDHRRNAHGDLEFLTRWSLAAIAEDSWEPASRFVADCCQPWLQYCLDRELPVDVGLALRQGAVDAGIGE